MMPPQGRPPPTAGSSGAGTTSQVWHGGQATEGVLRHGGSLQPRPILKGTDDKGGVPAALSESGGLSFALRRVCWGHSTASGTGALVQGPGRG